MKLGVEWILEGTDESCNKIGFEQRKNVKDRKMGKI